MEQSRLSEILNGFNGSEKHDIEYFLKIAAECKEDFDSDNLLPAILERLCESMSIETKTRFFEEMQKNGHGHLLKIPPVKLYGLDEKDVVEVKKYILGKNQSVREIPVDFKEAVLEEQPLVMSVPAEFLERLKKERRELLEDDEGTE